MALTEGSYRVVSGIGAPVRITLSGTVEAGDPVAYASGWYQADANNTRFAELVAGEAGIANDVITAYRLAEVGNFSGGTAGNPVYLSDTAGEYSETAGTVVQMVGKSLNATTCLIAPQWTGMGLNTLDSQPISIGTGRDVNILWNGTNLTIKPVANNTGQIHLGDGSTLGMDLVLYGTLSTNTVLFDQSADLLLLDLINQKFGDSDKLYFGDGTGATAAGDASIYWDATSLIVTGSPVVIQSASVKIGDATTDAVGFFGKTAASRQGTIADATGDDATAVNAIIDALQAFGLVSTT